MESSRSANGLAALVDELRNDVSGRNQGLRVLRSARDDDRPLDRRHNYGRQGSGLVGDNAAGLEKRGCQGDP
ncbi:hypothetical protein Q6274_28135, partial [Klebsiella pneumoniae]